jgi:putative ABC transport system ATP-binding protein
MTGPVIRLEGVSRVFRGHGFEITAVSDVTLEIPERALLVIAGPSGSGKTTLLNLMGGLDRPTSGEITARGLPLGGLDEEGLALYRRRQIGFIFQGNNLLPSLTVSENVELPLLLLGEDDMRQKVNAVLEHVGLARRGASFPQDLSGGEQQRVAIARALVHSPSIVLADEPTANLDSRTAEDIFFLLQRMNRLTGTIIIFATHDPVIVERAPSVLRLHDGKIQV